VGVLASTDWPATIAAIGAAVVSIVSAVFAGLNRRSLKIPSGGTIGQKVELTHDLAALTVPKLESIANGEAEPPHGVTPSPEAPTP